MNQKLTASHHPAIDTSDLSESARQQTKVITVTLNPTLDRTLTTHFFSLGYHNRTTGETKLDPAGRGVSISRALHALGVPTHAIVLVGHDATGRAYQALLAEEQYPITVLRHSGRTRSNIHLVDSGHNNHTVILDESDGVTWADRQELANALIRSVEKYDTVVFAGSLPGGMRADRYALLTSLVQTMGGAVAINAGGGEPLRESIQAKPLMMYLTQPQLEGLVNKPVRAFGDVLYFAQQLRQRGVRRILIGMAPAEVALLITEHGAWVAEWPDDELGNHTGRAEAMIAGYLSARLEGEPFDLALRTAAAMASYTVSQVGNRFATRQDLARHMERVRVRPAEELAPLTEMTAEMDAVTGSHLSGG